MALSLTQEHFWLFIGLLGLGLQLAVSAILAGRARGKVFTKKFMDEQFGDYHFKETKTAVSENGYPDMGNGRYSVKLQYNDWLYFNNAQRVHYNYLENFPLAVVFGLVAGLYYPGAAAICCGAIFVARIGYFFYNTAQGAAHNLRKYGSIISSLATWALFGLAVTSCVHFYNEFAPASSSSGGSGGAQPQPQPRKRG